MKRTLLYLFLLVALLVPSLLSANDISITGNIATENLIDSIALSPNTGMAYGIDKQTNRAGREKLYSCLSGKAVLN
ncbi:MAG: hypothetical protein KKC46_05380 [Proteobacteria bacterium]|nr:hypothetical protein [Pseudomonadota bacterium]